MMNKVQKLKKKEKCQDLTEPGQRDKDPEAAGKWVNAVTKKVVYPDKSHRWDRA